MQVNENFTKQLKKRERFFINLKVKEIGSIAGYYSDILTLSQKTVGS